MLFSCSQSVQPFESGHSKEAAVMKRALDLGHQETWVWTQNPSSATLSPILSSVRWVLRSKELVFSLWNSINSRGLYKYYLPCCCYHSLTWFGLFFKEARETMRFATAINRSWVVKGSVAAWSCWKKSYCWDAFNHGLQSSNCDWGDC